MLHVTKAVYLDGYRILVEFNDDTKGVADFSKKLKNDSRLVVSQLRNVDEFISFSIQAHTITWSNGVDFAPEMNRITGEFRTLFGDDSDLLNFA